MSTITFRCDACDRALDVPRALAGKRGRCSGCKHVVQVPGGAPRVVPVSEPATQSPLASLVLGFVFGGVGVVMASLL